MGPTGTGKSNVSSSFDFSSRKLRRRITGKFIEVATGITGLVGHSLQSATKKISIFRLTFPEIVDSDICFVDTPGFDDAYGSDEKTFQAISKFILKTCVILYFVAIALLIRN